ncbi:6-bladed beta-propeller [Inmirania thermothiophila]|uniref:NHL repeat-containing protein n=1 Tax=Inmirania thermothiophila TaxID=1750597 RepID=A0A3N1XQW9_9GAMM|nr:6-bladed beta-propeller [Inmirania thermothiophila]ROR29060.1 NHL repeat-containing protein [Inmirania thermothiophila]
MFGSKARLRRTGLAGAALLALAGCVSAPQQREGAVELVFPPPPDPPRFYFERTILTTAEVEPPDEEELLRYMLTGTRTARGVAFAKPFDVAVHEGRLFVSDTVRRVVYALDFPEHRWFEIGNRGDNGDLAKPLGLAVDAAGNLYVVDGTQKRVVIYDRDGNFLRAVGGMDILDRPSHATPDPEGRRLYVVDTGGVSSQRHRIVVFDALTGEHLYDIGKRGVGDGEFNLPRDISWGPDGNLYVVDGGNFRVQVITPDGKFVRKWGQVGRRFGQFARPKGIAHDPDGNVYVADAAFGNFQIFDPEGRLLMFIGERSETGGPAKYMLPAGITIDEDGRIYFVDQFFRKVDVFRPAGLAPDAGHLMREAAPKGEGKETAPAEGPGGTKAGG